MKKILILAMLVVVICFTFAACGCEHQYEEKITTEASCTAVGIKTFTCKECNESYTEEIPMIEHAYTSTVTKESTCAEKGIATFTCTVCSDSYTEELDLVAHTLGEATITKKPTCVAEGEKTATCTVCGATGVTEKIPTVEHTYQSQVKVAATCTNTGINSLTCSVCNNSKEETSTALGHDYKQSNVIAKRTCTSDGEVTITCSRCKDSYNETQKATGHDWKAATCDSPKTCANCRIEEGTKLGHNFSSGICSRCGRKSYSFSVDPLPTTRSMIVSSTQTTTDQVNISECTYTVSESGTLTVTVGYTKTFSRTDDKSYPAIGFSVAVLNSNRNIVSMKGVYERYVYVGQYKTSTVTFTGLEPGTYIIAFSNYFI